MDNQTEFRVRLVIKMLESALKGGEIDIDLLKTFLEDVKEKAGII